MKGGSDLDAIAGQGLKTGPRVSIHPQYPISVEGKNCWRRPIAAKASFLIDGEAYFSAFSAAAERAQHSVLILGWDIDSRVWLRRTTSPLSFSDELGLFLQRILSRRKSLEVFTLSWDFAMIYLFEREFLPVFKRPWRSHRRLHFRLDGHHPSGGSQHQKLVVMDDSIAFSGGFDLTNHRWDTPEHKAGDRRRVNPWGDYYEPFHDVQIAVSGDAAAALGDLARERWRRATGISLPRPPGSGNLWPEGLAPDLEDVPVAIARTEPQWDGHFEVREVESLFLDMIAAGRETLYFENQYFTSARIGDALIRRLTEPQGPEIVMVMSQRNSGWLEQKTMGAIRAELLQKMKAADRFKRLYLYCPALPGNERLEVHSKVLVVDDRMARVGSANLSNRSMRLDTECDLMIESVGEERVARNVAAFRNRLLSEHLGVSPVRLEEAIREEGSLARSVEKLRGGERTLIPMAVNMDPLWGNICLEAEFCDPEHPMSPETIVRQMLPEEFHRPAMRRLPWIIGLLIAISLLAISWRWTPLGTWIHPVAWIKQVEFFLGPPLSRLLFVAGAYVVGSFLVIPLTVLVLLSGFLFGLAHGFLYAWTGSMISALLLFRLGQALGREKVRRLSGKLVNRISYRLARHGFFAVAVLQILPIAPFTLVNLVAGASRVSFKSFLVGTMLGMVPLVFVVSLLGSRMMAAIREPGWLTFSTLAASSLLFLLLFFWLKRISNSGRGGSGPEFTD